MRIHVLSLAALVGIAIVAPAAFAQQPDKAKGGGGRKDPARKGLHSVPCQALRRRSGPDLPAPRSTREHAGAAEGPDRLLQFTAGCGTLPEDEEHLALYLDLTYYKFAP